MNARADFVDQLRTPPYSLEAEQSVLGGLLLDNRLFDLVGDSLADLDFYRSTHQEIFSAIKAQLTAGKSADVVTVWEAIKGSGNFSNVEMAELNELAQYVPSTANVRRYAEIIRDHSLSRRLVAAGDEISTLGFDTSLGFDARLEAATSKLTSLERTAPKEDWVSAVDGMVGHLEMLEDRNSGKVAGWSTGLIALDNVLDGGLSPGALYVIGARPSMGKTAFGMSIGLHIARDRAVGMLSMEMPHTDLNDRITAMLSRVDLSFVKRPARGLQWDRITEGCEAAKGLQWFASDQSNLNINQVRVKARQLKRKFGLSVLIVDYIGLMNGTDTKQPRVYQLEEISRGLKSLAKELEIAVLCLAQLNRKVEERTDHMPNLSDLRDSGAIEQDADAVMFIHRPIQSNPNLSGEWANYAKLIVAKNRQGRSGVILDLAYQGDQTRFSNWSGQAPTNQAVTATRKGFSHE